MNHVIFRMNYVTYRDLLQRIFVYYLLKHILQKKIIMKKQVIFICVLFLLIGMVSTQLHAQEAKSMQFGIKGGLNLSSLNSSDGSTSDMLLGFNLGVFDKLQVTSMLAIQPEFYVTTKGSSVTYDNLFANGTAKFNLTYLEIPLLCVVNFTKLLNVQFGPYVAYMVDGKVTNEANVTLFNYEQNINVSDYNRIDAGVVLGAAFEVGNITMGARYNWGLTKVGKTRTLLGSDYTVPDATNGVLNFNLAIAF